MKKMFILLCIAFALQPAFAENPKTLLLSLPSVYKAKQVPKHPTFCELALIFFEKGNIYSTSIDTLGNWSEEDQENFIDYLDEHGVEQTMIYYQLSEELVRNVVNSWADLDASYVDLVEAMYGSVDTLTIPQFTTLLDSAILCYYETYIGARMAPPGCDEEWDACTDAAFDWYIDRLEGCFGLGLGVSVGSGGLGLGLGIGCIAISGHRYNKKLKKCDKAWSECASN